MKRTLLRCLLCINILSLIFAGCRQDNEEAIEKTIPEVYLIPEPAHSTVSADVFELIGGRVAAPDELAFEATFLIELIKRKTGVDMSTDEPQNTSSSIRLVLDPAFNGEEAYALDVTPTQITMQAKSAAGIFYAIQTFRQLLPVRPPAKNIVATIPCISVRDQPRFGYRGMHLDVSRHFFDVSVIKRYLDMLARYKFNYFHWHLTDDQGWRVQIDAYPKLNTISSWRSETLIGHHNDQPWKFDGRSHGGFYTKEQIRDIVAYAAERHITIIPEIEMPGHAQAVLAAYPELGCTGKKVEVRKVWGVSEDVLCPKEETFEFLETVLSEVIDLFPGRYIHIGGDECPKTQWKQSQFCQDLMLREGLSDEHHLQSWFVQRIERFINSKGRRMIGWDEILEGGLAPNAVVMSWRGISGGIEAAKQAHDVIMTPTTHVYFDYYQSLHPEEPHAIGGYLPLQKVYRYEPVPEELTPEQHKYILGAQANLWTEYIETPLKLDYMAWPRGIALAEVVWSQLVKRNFTDFAERLDPHVDLLRSEGIYVANHLYDLDYFTKVDNGRLTVAFAKFLPHIVVNYSTDGEKTWNPIATPLQVDSSMTLMARSETDKGFKGRPLQIRIDKHLAAGKSITVAHDPDPLYNTGGIQSLINGIQGSERRFQDKEWLGFLGTDCEATLDLGSIVSVSTVETRFFGDPANQIHLPADTEVFLSADGVIFTSIGRMDLLRTESGTGKGASAGPVSGKVHSYQLMIDPVETRYIRIVVTNASQASAEPEALGNKLWLFVDEFVVH